jgi:N-acetylglucosamine-6-sulfatase
MTTTRRNFLKAATGGPFIQTSRAASRRPNFVFMLTDDQSYSTLSCTGSAFMKTPNIDRLAKEGALFTNAFVAMSLCAPSRACNLTGLYPQANGIYNNQIRFNQELQTLPRLLHDSGWRTAHIGKWHMDGDDRLQPGYDYWAAQVGQGQYVDPRKNINGKWVDLRGYDTTIITDQALEFMRSSKGQPFCLWMGYKACHGPFTPAPGHENDFANVEFKPPASYYSDNAGKPARVRAKGPNRAGKQQKRGKKARPQDTSETNLTLAQWAERERNQHRCLMGVDDSAARILGYLDDARLAEDTIIVYMGDNGFFHGEFGLSGKMEAYEPSLRVPMLMRYPRLVKAGQRVNEFVANVDLLSTITDFCGVKPGRPVQGHSWAPLVAGRTPGRPWRKEFLYQMFSGGATAATPTVKALRTDRYKLILNLNPKDVTEVYDLREDPLELKNIALEKGGAGLVKDLTRQMLAVMKELEDPALPLVESTLKG